MVRRIVYLLIALVILGGVVWFAGPREPADTTVSFDADMIGEDVAAWLAESESRFDDIEPGLEKEIVWAYPASRARTPLAIIYVHGFSASKGEIRPLPDMVAAELGANLFYTRLTGHGRSGAAMAEATVNAWVNDFAEAVAIGRRIGERVVVIATSTGGGLSAWAATQPDLMDDVAAMVLVSPNFGPRSFWSFLLAGPWARQLVGLFLPEERGFTPSSDIQARYWTESYPSQALLPMATMTALAAAAPVENARVPALFVFSEGDRVVRPEMTQAIAARWGAAHDIVVVDNAEDANQHVIAGDAYSPGTTGELARRIVAFVSARTR